MGFIQNWIEQSEICPEDLMAVVSRVLNQPDNVVFTGTPSGGVGPYTYLWTITGGVDGTDFTNNTGNLTSQTLDLTAINQGTYSVSLIVTDASGDTANGTSDATYSAMPGSFSNSFSLSFSSIGTLQIS